MIGIVYWTSTGNTQAMAEAIAKGVAEAGGEVIVKTVSETTKEDIVSWSGVALGCPDMGIEQLEEDEFAPFYESIKPLLNQKKVALFGSYGWGGTWMTDWANDAKTTGCELVSDGLAVFGAPDEAALADCEALGKSLV